MKGVFPCSYELWAYGDQQCPCDPDLHAVAASSSFPAALSEPGSCRMGPHVSSGTHGRVLERRSPPPGEMFSQLYGTGCTTLCAMSASVQEKQAALSQLPARLLPPAVRAPPAAMRAKIGWPGTNWCFWADFRCWPLGLHGLHGIAAAGT